MKQHLQQVANPVLPMQLFLAAAPFALGCFYEWTSAAAALFLLGYLLHCGKKSEIIIPHNLLFWAMLSLPIAFAASVIWAVDRGMALLGVVKFLTLPLFVLCMAQLSAPQRATITDYVPLSGAVMIVLSFLASRLPAIADYFLVEERLSGFFQYPNTFALFLLIGFALALFRQAKTAQDYALALLLAIGVLLTGSRTTFILLIIAVICFLFWNPSKRIGWLVAAAAAALLLGVCVYVLITGNLASIGRFLTTSLSSSTFLVRLLYNYDALPVVASHPFGLGYYGYYFLQGSFQTGVYSIKHVHNDLLQVFLDAGWIPAVLCILAVIRGLRRTTNIACRVVILLTVVHALFEFDLQFAAIDFLLLAALYDASGGKKRRVKPALRRICAAALCAFCLWVGGASALYSLGFNDATLAVYPGYTLTRIDTLKNAADAAEMEAAADALLAYNDSVALAHSAKARAAFSRGDFAAVITEKERAIALSRYALEEYLDYFDMLEVGAALYEKAGDAQSAEYCIERLRAIPIRLQEAKESVSSLGWKITHKPELDLPESYQARLTAW